MLNTGPRFFGSASLINFLLSLPFQNVMAEKSVHHQRLLLSTLFTCSFVCCCVSWSPPRFQSFFLPPCSFSAMLYLFPSHFLILSLFCLFRPFPISLLPRWLSFSLRLIPTCPPVVFFAFSPPFYTSFSSMCLSSSMQHCPVAIRYLQCALKHRQHGWSSTLDDFHKTGDRENYQVLISAWLTTILLYYQWCSFRIFTFFQGAWKREKKILHRGRHETHHKQNL